MARGPAAALILAALAWLGPARTPPQAGDPVDLTVVAGQDGGASATGWRQHTVDGGVASLLQAVSAVDEATVWLSGHRGTWLRSTDGGDTWQAGTVPGGEELEFRDVRAFDADTAFLLSAGPGEASRIYRTDDGGAHWTLQFRNEDPRAFFDCLDFWGPDRGLAFSDSVDGRLVILRTEDGGVTWRQVPAAQLPAALPGEGGFAASGTCLITAPGGRAWIGTGAAPAARVLASSDWGRTWAVAPTPLVTGPAAGIASLVLSAPATLLALGGDIGDPASRPEAVARSTDGGRSWALVSRPAFAGAIYGSALVPGTTTLFAVGPSGLAVSDDLGDSWKTLDAGPYWAVGFGGPGRGWAVGPVGKITILERDP